MRTATDCTHRAEECRSLARLAVKPEDFRHFLEMAETWELLTKHRKAAEQLAEEQTIEEQIAEKQLADIVTLADAIANRRDKINLPTS